MAVFIQHACVAGVKVALCINHFGRGIRAFVVLLEYRHPFDQYFTVVRNLQFNAGGRLAYGIEFDLSIFLDADISAGLGLAIQLLEVDANGAEKLEQVRANGRARGVGHADTRQPHDVAQWAIDKQVTQAILEAIPGAHRLAVQDVGTHTLG